MFLLFQEHIFKNLKVKDLGRVARVSKKANKATDSEELWKHFLYKELGKYYEGTFQRSVPRGGSRTAATSKMERFVIIVNG